MPGDGRGSNKIGRITTGGDITEFPIPSSNTGPEGIVSGPDGAMWFTEAGTDKIGRITMAGAISEICIPSTKPEPLALTVGSDGALWFTEVNANKIGRFILPHGSPLPSAHDFDSDTDSDILWRDTNGNLTMWMMNGTSVKCALVIGNLPTFWTIVGQRDFNGDGFADILWRNSFPGQVVIWFMSAATVIGGGSPGTVTLDWMHPLVQCNQRTTGGVATQWSNCNWRWLTWFGSDQLANPRHER